MNQMQQWKVEVKVDPLPFGPNFDIGTFVRRALQNFIDENKLVFDPRNKDHEIKMRDTASISPSLIYIIWFKARKKTEAELFVECLEYFINVTCVA